MAYSTVLAIIIGEWNAVTATQGLIDWEEKTPHNTIQYGVSLKRILFGFGALGYNRKIVKDMSGDVYATFVMGTTDEEVRDQIKAILEVAKDWQGTPNSDEYARLHVNNRSNISYTSEEEFMQQDTWKFATIGILASRTGEILP